MKIQTTFAFILLFILFSNQAHSQYLAPQTYTRNPQQLNYRNFVLPGPLFEFGLGIGASNSLTDIASSRVGEQASMTDIYSQGMMPALSVYGRYHSGRLFAFKSTFTTLMLKGDDRWSSEIGIIDRNKSFTNRLYELSMMGEIYLPRRYSNPKQDFQFSWVDFYLFSGLNAFYHDPEVEGPFIDDYDRELLTSDNLYNNFQVAIPIGAGLTLNLYNRWTIGLDFNFRYTFFDFLDGFKRPYSNRNDFYFTSNINLGYIINSDSRRSNKIARKKVFRPNNPERLVNKR